MSNKEFQLEIITPEKVVFSEKVAIVTAPGKDGYLGILANHAPLLTSLKPGKVEIRKTEGSTPIYINVEQGFLETSNNAVDIIVEEAEIEK